MQKPANGIVFGLAWFVFLAVGTVRGDTISNVNTDFDAGFTAGTNPNGVWSYGWSSTPTSLFHLYPRHRFLPSGMGIGNGQFGGWDDPANNILFTPLVYKNFGTAVNDGNIDIPANALILHGGGNGANDHSDVLFTAPTAGTYILAATFIGRQNAVNADVNILQNGTSLFTHVINADGASTSFGTSFSLLAGDQIEFSVGLNGGGLHPGSVELQATVTAQESSAVPEPASLTLLGLGALGLLGYGWRQRSRSESRPFPNSKAA